MNLRKTVILFVAVLIFCCIVPQVLVSPSLAGTPNQYDDIARLIAGMPPREGSRLGHLYGMDAVKRHVASSTLLWDRLQQDRLFEINRWREKTSAHLFNDSRTVFYPFSGPDILYPRIFFPAAKTYIMVGLEPVGPLPSLDSIKRNLERSIRNIRNFNDLFLKLSFYRTNGMRDDFEDKLVEGVIPVLMTLIVRTGGEISSVSHVSLDTEGKIVPWLHNEPDSKRIQGVRIEFINQDRSFATVYYFRTDLEDSGLKQHPEFLRFVSSQGDVTTMLKAASYLMHRPTFSKIRKLVIDKSALVMQDDSGIPLSFFPKEKWSRRFYGAYTEPIPLFACRAQHDLKMAYCNPDGKVPFSYGYKFHRNQSNIMIALRKK
jgi:hypothetical protein